MENTPLDETTAVIVRKWLDIYDANKQGDRISDGFSSAVKAEIIAAMAKLKKSINR